MKKIYTSVVAIVLLLGANFAAAANTNAEPFQDLWDAIAGLQQQIDEIELIPGPPGPTGEDGEDGLSCWDLNGNGIGDPEEDVNDDGNFDALDCQGPQGEQGVVGPEGPIGPAGPGLKVVDANGDEVGHFVDFEMPAGDRHHDVRVFNTDLRLFLALEMYGATFTEHPDGGSNTSLYFTTTDCSGSAYVRDFSSPYRMVKTESAPGSRDFTYYRADSFDDVFTDLHIHSTFSPGDPCEPRDEVFPFALRVHEFEPPTFAGPLTIVQE